jgi:hypothetical protein
MPGLSQLNGLEALTAISGANGSQVSRNLLRQPTVRVGVASSFAIVSKITVLLFQFPKQSQAVLIGFSLGRVLSSSLLEFL